ncbi:hypothetical protein PGTUg99_000539 [Puccinia graminis f. sp. tritici]|uniref:Uncharacterized protein n=1 Tax=Puccinia graminis f. sp. tritici TaxID=56615 RepID=A0A5B0RZ23_PUCGR|nr:hypothetical protein PGTUg99_000539 [Puccinia graminis f. sp. tritici]
MSKANEHPPPNPLPHPLQTPQRTPKQITLPESSKKDAPPHGPSTSNTENTGGERESRRTSGPDDRAAKLQQVEFD